MIKWLISFFKRLFHRPKPIKEIEIEIESGDCKARITKGWTSAYLVKKNKRTCWVRLFDWNIIKRKNRQVKIL